MSIGRRLSKLESRQNDNGVIAIPVPVGVSDDEAVRKHFDNEEPPENALIVLIRRFCESAP